MSKISSIKQNLRELPTTIITTSSTLRAVTLNIQQCLARRLAHNAIGILTVPDPEVISSVLVDGLWSVFPVEAVMLDLARCVGSREEVAHPVDFLVAKGAVAADACGEAGCVDGGEKAEWEGCCEELHFESVCDGYRGRCGCSFLFLLLFLMMMRKWRADFLEGEMVLSYRPHISTSSRSLSPFPCPLQASEPQLMGWYYSQLCLPVVKHQYTTQRFSPAPCYRQRMNEPGYYATCMEWKRQPRIYSRQLHLYPAGVPETVPSQCYGWVRMFTDWWTGDMPSQNTSGKTRRLHASG